MLALHWILPLRFFSNWLLFIFGLGLMVLGIVMAIGAEGQFRRSRTTVDHLGMPAKLVTAGWFKSSRNPMYLSFMLMLIGAWLVLGSISPHLCLAAYFFLTERWYITSEEKRLMATFGKQYDSYRMRTRRWL
jgi:protein-S-isoprenylcysteine O-methyltransferase Ste14